MKTRIVTIREVAKRAEVSISTVSRVINNSAPVNQPIRGRVLQAIEALGYTPDKSAQVLKKQKTGIIGVIIPDISNPFFSLMVRGVEKAARSYGYSVIICDTNNELEIENDAINTLVYERVEGVVLTSNQQKNDKITRLLKRNIPIVAADRRLKSTQVSSVLIDGMQDSKLLICYLLELGYQNISFLAGPDYVTTAQDRLQGFRQTMEAHNLPAPSIHSQLSDYTFESGYQAMKDILKSRSLPEAIVAANDLMAIGALRALEQQQIKIPQDIGLAGFDHIPLSDWIKPRLTTVDIPAYDIGWQAMELLINVIINKEAPHQKIISSSKLVKAESTRRIR